MRVGGWGRVGQDGVVVEGGDLRVDESAVTGEAEPARKAPPGGPGGDARVLAGCTVAGGHGAVLVCAVGPRTEWGRIRLAAAADPAGGGGGGGGADAAAAATAAAAAAAPFGRRVAELAARAGRAGAVAAVVTFALQARGGGGG